MVKHSKSLVSTNQVNTPGKWKPKEKPLLQLQIFAKAIGFRHTQKNTLFSVFVSNT
uniref:Uncharacterized protein n=1 Tax=Daphnia magna TaxID=35525 RepID=A0A0P5ZAD5_9CRUS